MHAPRFTSWIPDDEQAYTDGAGTDPKSSTSDTDLIVGLVSAIVWRILVDSLVDTQRLRCFSVTDSLRIVEQKVGEGEKVASIWRRVVYMTR
jgi:hypothetical protein